MLWRLHLKTDPKNGKTHHDVVQYCIENNIAGIGWPVNSVPNTPEEYERLVLEKYGKRTSSVRFSYDPKSGDLIWARDKSGSYYLGVISGDWQYSDNLVHEDLDIPNQRKCVWAKIENEENVPGKVVACFRPTRTFQNISDADGRLEDFSKWLFNQKIGAPSLQFKNIKTPNINNDSNIFFQLIGYEDCEDIVGIYLQHIKGYLLIPSSCKKDTAGYEFILKNPKNGNTAAVQVKQGSVNLDDSLKGSADRIYLFSTEGLVNAKHSSIEVLTSAELFNFVIHNKSILPARIQYWLQFLNNDLSQEAA